MMRLAVITAVSVTLVSCIPTREYDPRIPPASEQGQVIFEAKNHQSSVVETSYEVENDPYDGHSSNIYKASPPVQPFLKQPLPGPHTFAYGEKALLAKPSETHASDLKPYRPLYSVPTPAPPYIIYGVPFPSIDLPQDTFQNNFIDADSVLVQNSYTPPISTFAQTLKREQTPNQTPNNETNNDPVPTTQTSYRSPTSIQNSNKESSQYSSFQNSYRTSLPVENSYRTPSTVQNSYKTSSSVQNSQRSPSLAQNSYRTPFPAQNTYRKLPPVQPSYIETSPAFFPSQNQYVAQKCEDGEVKNILGVCVVPDVIRDLFVFVEPKAKVVENEDDIYEQIPHPKIKYNIVVIRTDDENPEDDPIVIPPPQEKTMVLVLKKNEEDDTRKVIEVPSAPSQGPEVYFINYEEGQDTDLPGGITLQEALAHSFASSQYYQNNYNSNQGMYSYTDQRNI